MKQEARHFSGVRFTNKPTQKALSAGYMDYDEYVTDNGHGKFITTYKPLITGKGQIYFVKKLLEVFE